MDVFNIIIELWLPLFEETNLFVVGNEENFANEDIWELGINFGIDIKHTVVHSPLAIGLNKHNHEFIALMLVKKMLEGSPNHLKRISLLVSRIREIRTKNVKGFK